ncbi:DUF397 domain-containing protein [Streptomyces sp. NPDC057654]|uniref:DUF397 domain-containing protein n=1 Tax=Streptomyces sp. NPDC057654 TaxID=3346196 RepID=UPI0036BAA1A1
MITINANTTATGRPYGQWFKSSYSDNQGTECVEACPMPHVVHVRDSKQNNDDEPPVLTFTAAAWTSFTDHVTHADHPSA